MLLGTEKACKNPILHTWYLLEFSRSSDQHLRMRKLLEKLFSKTCSYCTPFDPFGILFFGKKARVSGEHTPVKLLPAELSQTCKIQENEAYFYAAH